MMPPLGRFLLYFLRLGALGFGGPIALAGAMQRDLVEKHGWIAREDYLEGLALAQMAPGPLAAQLAMYLGYVRGGVIGATVSGSAFVLPSLLMVWALAAAYVRFDGLRWMQAVFYGIGAAVVGIIARSVLTLARLTLARDRLSWTIAVTLAVTTAVTARENVALFVASGFVPLLIRRARSKPHQMEQASALLLPVAAGAGLAAGGTSLPALGWFFARAAIFVFGSGLAVIPFLYGGVVQERHWLNDRQFLDAVAVAMITPGPVVITVGFIGYLVRGTAGLFVAAAAIFLPVYLVVVIAAPWFRRYHRQPEVKAFVSGVTAAATGAIAGAGMLLGARAIVDVWTAAIAAGTFVALWRWRISELWLIGAAGGLGLCLR